jgi:hypothetical protein
VRANPEAPLAIQIYVTGQIVHEPILAREPLEATVAKPPDAGSVRGEPEAPGSVFFEIVDGRAGKIVLRRKGVDVAVLETAQACEGPDPEIPSRSS